MKFEYSITRELLQELVKAGTLEEKLRELGLSPSLRTTLFQDTKIRTSHFSNKIEGNRLTLEQSEEVWKGKMVDAPSRDIQEVKNLFSVFDFLLQEAKQEKPATPEMICTIHRYVEKNIVRGKLLGHYRETQNAIFDSSTNKIVYMPPEAKDVPSLMAILIDIINNKEWEHDLIKAAVAHYGLVTIHPFMDGNGRTARALSAFLLMQSRFQFVRYMAWDEYFYQHRSTYYQILHNTQGNNFYDLKGVWNIQSWLEFFISGIVQTIQRFLDQVKTSSTEIFLNKRQEKALRFLKRRLKITNSDYCKLNKVSNFTARADLRELEKRGLVRQIGQGRSVHYILK